MLKENHFDKNLSFIEFLPKFHLSKRKIIELCLNNGKYVALYFSLDVIRINYITVINIKTYETISQNSF